jgi:phospholipid transport system substrate-binding protein
MGVATLLMTAMAATTPNLDTGPVTPDAALNAITRFDEALSASMQRKDAAHAKAIADAFHVGTMAAYIVGAPWAAMSSEDKAQIIDAFGRFLTARFATELDAASAVSFRINADIQTRGPDKFIRTEVTQGGGAPTHLDYRLRSYGGQWRIIDVYYEGVSQLALSRTDVAHIASQPAALIAHFNGAADALHHPPTSRD